MPESGGWRERFESYALLWGLLVVVGVLSTLPLARLLAEGVAPQGEPTAAPIARVLSSAVTWTATQHSLVTAVGGTLLALAIGGVVALVVSLTDIRARNAFVFCFVLPMMIAPQVVALAWLQLFGPASPLLKALGVAQDDRRPQPALFTAGDHRRARRTVRAARVPHAARGDCARCRGR
jgi:iron(III) transport system permease protein